jgi:predicted RNase H-like HicB family nuclease
LVIPRDDSRTVSRIIRAKRAFEIGLERGMRLQHTVKASLRKGEHYYVAECIEISVVTQGRTVDETLANLQEAIALHLGGENPADFGLVPHPTILLEA